MQHNNCWTLSWFTHQEQNHKTRMTLHAPVALCHMCPTGIHQIYLTYFSSQIQHEPWIVWGCLQDMMENPALRGCVSFSTTQRSRMCYLLKPKGSLHAGCKSQRSFQLESSEKSAFHIHHHLTIMVHQWLVHTTRPKAWKPDDPWIAELLGLKNFTGFVANNLQSPEASSKFWFLSIIIKKYQGYITESTSQSEARYFSFSTACRSALAGFGKEVFEKGSPDCSSLSVSIITLPVCMCWNHPMQKRHKASNLT